MMLHSRIRPQPARGSVSLVGRIEANLVYQADQQEILERERRRAGRSSAFSVPAASNSKDPTRNRPAVLVAGHPLARSSSSSNRSAASTARRHSSAVQEIRPAGVSRVRHSSLPTISDNSPLAAAPAKAERFTQAKMVRSESGWKRRDSAETLHKAPEVDGHAVTYAPTGRTRGQLVYNGLKWGSWKLLRLGLLGYGLDLRMYSNRPSKAEQHAAEQHAQPAASPATTHPAADEPSPEAAPAPPPDAAGGGKTAGAENKARKVKARACRAAGAPSRTRH